MDSEVASAPRARMRILKLFSDWDQFVSRSSTSPAAIRASTMAAGSRIMLVDITPARCGATMSARTRSRVVFASEFPVSA